MKKYMLVMMTSVNCVHCHDLRGKGVLGCGAHFMKPSVVKDLLSFHNRINMINIHFDGGGKTSNIVEISKITKEGENLIQELWCESEKMIKTLTIYSYSDTKKFLRVKREFTGVWSDLVGKMIPSKIENYTFYYPCFMMVETQNWIDSINKNHELYGVTNAGKTIKDGHTVKLDKDGESLNERIIEPAELIKKVTSGVIPLDPTKPILKVEEPTKPILKVEEPQGIYSRY
jgi:hypothetical protein